MILLYVLAIVVAFILIALAITILKSDSTGEPQIYRLRELNPYVHSMDWGTEGARVSAANPEQAKARFAEYLNWERFPEEILDVEITNEQYDATVRRRA